MKPKQLRQPSRLVESEERALADLRFIRETMERSGSFTAIPGYGLMSIGVSALVAAVVAAQQTDDVSWLMVWFCEAVFAVLLGLFCLHRKASATGSTLMRGPGRRFLLGLGPAILCGAILTPALYQAGQFDFIPGLWLLLYGAAVVAAGMFSVPAVPIMGIGFMLVGSAATFSPASALNEYMALGFGGLHLSFGFLIARKNGG